MLEGCAGVLSSQTSPHEGEPRKCGLLVPLYACQLYVYSSLSACVLTYSSGSGALHVVSFSSLEEVSPGNHHHVIN